jgi:multiple sugar transport system permease protein
MLFGAVMAITQSFNCGAVVNDLAGFPSVNYCAHTIMHHLQDYGGQRFEVGYSSAIAVILFIMMIGSNMLINKILNKVGQ